EPNIIAHAQLITPDIAATSLGLVAMWFYWRWLARKSWSTALLSGMSLGLAVVAKFSWLILFGIWPTLWLISQLRTPASSKKPGAFSGLFQLVTSLLAALYLINTVYAFDGSFSRLDSFEFASTRLSGHDQTGGLGNRFTGTTIAGLRLPLPRQFVLGLDLQQKDFEHFPHQSYLRGDWRQGGWWYYYLYAAAVKIPLGLWLLGFTAIAMSIICRRPDVEDSRDRNIACTILLVPSAILFAIVSSQTAFNHHFRYVLPCFGPAFVLISPIATASSRALKSWAFANGTWIAISSALAAPFSLSYFNELAGGRHNGSAHLLHSNIDWGQDLVALNQWIASNPDSRPLYLAYYGFYDPVAYGVPALDAPQGPFWRGLPRDWSFRPGWYAVSVNYLHGTAWRLTNRHAYEPLRDETPIAWCGGSIAIYEVDQILAKKLNDAVLRNRQSP
ncbi:MAG TPA: hypothetical protein VM510_08120, partial [Caulifigura sp.]|nr:hypothetical protein [Caulifigura sp.]